jgi:hypothetical protein
MKKDEQAGGVDCFVISYSGPNTLTGGSDGSGVATTTLWIGKVDHLIRQLRIASDAGPIATPEITDETARKMLAKQNKPVTAENIAALRAEMEAYIQKVQGGTGEGKMAFTQTHENIAVNGQIPRSEFQP